MQYATRVNSNQFDLCDQCHRNGVVLLRSMTKWSPFDWFRCIGCDHIFTRVRPSDLNVAEHRPLRRDRRLTVNAADKPSVTT